MHEAFFLLRLLVFTAAFWNVLTCAQSFWAFSRKQTASNWARSVIFVMSLGIMWVNLSYLAFGVEEVVTLERAMSLMLVAAGCMLGVYGQRIRIYEQFDVSDEMIDHLSTQMAMLDLAREDPAEAERLAETARKTVAALRFAKSYAKIAAAEAPNQRLQKIVVENANVEVRLDDPTC